MGHFSWTVPSLWCKLMKIMMAATLAHLLKHEGKQKYYRSCYWLSSWFLLKELKIESYLQCSLLGANLRMSEILRSLGLFTVLYLVAKPLIWSEAVGDLVVIETSTWLAWQQSNLHLRSSKVCIITWLPLASLLLKGLETKHTPVKWTIMDWTNSLSP